MADWRRFCAVGLAVAVCGCLGSCSQSKTDDDLVFIHHSCGRQWLESGLHKALKKKDYIDSRNDIHYGADFEPDAGRPDSLEPAPGDKTDMNHWVRWFNDYLGSVLTEGCKDGRNRIVMFKSCFPNSTIEEEGQEPGDPFTGTRSITNRKAIFRHPEGPGTRMTGRAWLTRLWRISSRNTAIRFSFT